MDASQDVIIDFGNLLKFNTDFPPCTSEGSSTTLILHMEGTQSSWTFVQGLWVACGTTEL